MSKHLTPAMKVIVSRILFDAIRDAAGVSEEKMRSGARQKPLPFLRGIFFFIMYREVEVSVTELGEMLGRDHSTVIYWKNNHEVHMNKLDGDYRRWYSMINDKFNKQKKDRLQGESLDEQETYLVNYIAELKEELVKVREKKIAMKSKKVTA
jgi:hypothetical protein